MANLRIIAINAADSRTIKVKFSAKLNPNIKSQNILIEGVNESTPNAEVRSAIVIGDILSITVLPLTPFAQYKATFRTSGGISFQSEDGISFLIEDGNSNTAKFLGAENPSNIIRDNLVSLLSGQPYNPDRGTIIRTVFNEISENILRAQHDIRQFKNDNYLSFNVTNERKRRGYGPFDRLNEEGAYHISRVGLTKENQILSKTMSFSSFPFDLITLQGVEVDDERLEAGDGSGTFDKLTFTLENEPVTKVTNISILYQDGSVFEYDISSNGYLIKDPKYDTEFASTLLLLDDNQVKLNDEILNDTSFKVPENGDIVSIDYEYKSIGRVIDEDSVKVFQRLSAVREATPALANEFSLNHAPIVDSSGKIPTLGGVQFLDPNTENPFTTTHPAFKREVVFKASFLPKNAGEYAIDYERGRVFVYGESDDDGTGDFPPAATYNYKSFFKKDLDYTYRDDTSELVASPLRNLEGKEAKISFLYEQTLVEGVDYKVASHNEVLNERIKNRILSANSLRVANSGITNVFRIFNETTGEIYRVNRFLNDKVVFSSNTPPDIQNESAERSVFKSEKNEQLIVTNEFFNTLGTRIFKIDLINENIISASEDVIGSSYNTSVAFSREDVFQQERFYESQIVSVSINTDKLTVGDYQIDYRNGIIYVGVSSSQDLGLGTVSYKKPIIEPENPHVISVSDIYYSLNLSNGVIKRLDYSSFEDGAILPSVFDVSDERFLNGDESLPYLVSNGQITVSDDVKTVRHVFDNDNLLTSNNPVDFGPSATHSGNIIILDEEGVETSQNNTVSSGLKITINTGSSGISLLDVKSVVRLSDNTELLDGYETISGNTITLSGSSGASVGDAVNVIYTIELNSISTPIVDYDRGGHYIDYTYLADEILVSYEYGDNVLDFRESTTLDVGDEYFVSYKAGALRDSLLSNFGSMINIPELNSFSTDLERERYRDALIGALQSFTKGPTNPSMKEMVAEITKIQPEIIEAIFQYWSLGISPIFENEFLLKPNTESAEKRTLVPGKFDGGYLPTQDGDSITFPVSSNVKLNEGTIEFTTIPQWNGLDNDASITFSNLKKDGYSISSSNVYIGSSSYNPTFSDGSFTISRFDDISPSGLPQAVFTKTGVFIFYDEDDKRWKILAKESTNDGYTFSGEVFSSGDFYDVKKIDGVGDVDDIIRSTHDKIEFTFNINGTDQSSPDGYSTTDGYVSGYSFDGLSFMADSLHYFFDFAETSTTNRFSIYKDGRGYLNFAVWDKGGAFGFNPSRRSKYLVSADIQDWESGEEHNIGVSWKLNTKDGRDEMHLFIDGEEVPNILRYGGIPAASSTDRFRTVSPEVVVGTVPKPAVAGTMQTTKGSNIVIGNGVDFGVEGIVPGDTIEIQETGFSTYVITNVSGSSLTLDSNMPATLSDARFTVNPFSVVVSSEIDIYKNIAVSKLVGSTETEIPGVRADIPGYSITKNASNQNVLKILGYVEAGAQILIRTLGLNHRKCKERVYLWNDQAVLKTQLPPPINLDETSIRSVLLPYTIIGPDNATISSGNFNISLNTTEVSNTTEGRQLEVRISGGNVDFSTPTTVTINGTSDGGASEVLSFSAAGKKNTTNKWKTITSVDVVTKPITTGRNGAGIEIKEAYSVTVPNGNNIYPVIRFGFQTQSGLTLEGDGYVVSDDNGFFANSEVGNIMVIESPPSAAGTFTIAEKISNTSVRLDGYTGPAFSNGKYKIFNISIGRSGFQNGFFFLEQAGTVNTPYDLPEGFYEFDYSTYLSVPFSPIEDLTAYLGSDFSGNNTSNAIIDEFRILSTQLTDTRVGETLADNEFSITTGANKISPFRKNNQTLVLLHLDGFPIVNDSDYFTFSKSEFVQSSSSVNSNFGQSICFTDKGLGFDNKNRLTTDSEGSIEFWVSPRYDTYNDPVPRVYFDAAASIAEEVTSTTKGTVVASSRIGEVLSVRLATDVTQTGTDYFAGGNLDGDAKTIRLGTALPFQQTPVIITYTPSSVDGDRLTILKDSEGFISFNVIAGDELFQVRQPVFWARDTWHRVKATFKFNTANDKDQIRLFIDGEERGSIRFGDDIVFGSGLNFGATSSGVTDQILIANIDFKDLITRFYVGQDFRGSFPAQARIDNLRVSNKSLDSITIGGQPIDFNFSTNSESIFPVIENAYTTMLLDFDRIVQEVEDFAILRDSVYGIFNFTLNIIDSFGIVEESERVQSMLEAMIFALKPANAKVDIEYFR